MDELTRFLRHHKWTHAEQTQLVPDASARRYYRLSKKNETCILMDAHQIKETLAPFENISNILHDIGIKAPQIYASDPQNGYMLVEDFGDLCLATRLDEIGSDTQLYREAVDILIRIRMHFNISDGFDLPRYNSKLFAKQAALFAKTIPQHTIGQTQTEEKIVKFTQAWEKVLHHATSEMPTLLLRDYHAANLMLLKGGMMGVLDFQDAGIGPAEYDLVSLLQDARRDIPQGTEQQLLRHYLDAFTGINEETFMRHYHILGALRHTRVIAVFMRLAQNGKTDYLTHMPRLFKLLDRNLSHPDLSEIKTWIDRLAPTETQTNLLTQPQAGLTA